MNRGIRLGMPGPWSDAGLARSLLAPDFAAWAAVEVLVGHRKHIEPYLGGVPVGKLSTRQIREWRAALLANGVSASMAAKAYRLVRAILTTAVEDDNLLSRNPCRNRGAGTENAGERPVLTVAQVFEVAEQVGRRPVGNIRQIPDGYRLRFGREGEMRTSPEVYASRAEAERALWKMASDGRATVTMTAGSTPWCSWPPLPACAGARRPRCGDATST